MLLGWGRRRHHLFKFLDLLYQENAKNNERNKARAAKQEGGKKEVEEPKKKEQEEKTEVNNIPTKEEVGVEIAAIIEYRSDEDEWINLSEIGNMLLKRIPGFDPRNYNFSKLGKLIKSYDFLEINTKRNPNPNDKSLKIVYVRMKQ